MRLLLRGAPRGEDEQPYLDDGSVTYATLTISTDPPQGEGEESALGKTGWTGKGEYLSLARVCCMVRNIKKEQQEALLPGSAFVVWARVPHPVPCPLQGRGLWLHRSKRHRVADVRPGGQKRTP